MEAALLMLDPRDERVNCIGHQMVHLDGDPVAAGRVDKLSGLLDRLRAVHF
jgi:hypothetical protein